MTKWHSITAKFTDEEKKILDILRDTYGLNHNQTLRKSVEMLARLMASTEYQVTVKSPIAKKVKKIIEKYMKLADAEIKKSLKEFPKEQQEAEYQMITDGHTTVLSHFDKVFVKNRKKGRKKSPRRRGKPSTRL